MTPPEPNGDPVRIGDVTVELQVCADTCCPRVIKKTGKPNLKKERYFVRDKSGQAISMANDWDTLCRAQGWT